MYVLTNSPKYTCQKRRNKIPKDDLEAVLVEQIKHFSISLDEISAHLERANVTIHTKAELLKVLELERQELAARVVIRTESVLIDHPGMVKVVELYR